MTCADACVCVCVCMGVCVSVCVYTCVGLSEGERFLMSGRLMLS